MSHTQVALHMRATRTFTDKTGIVRKNGEEWLIKMEDTEAHIPDVYEEVSKLCMYQAAIQYTDTKYNVAFYILFDILRVCV